MTREGVVNLLLHLKGIWVDEVIDGRRIDSYELALTDVRNEDVEELIPKLLRLRWFPKPVDILEMLPEKKSPEQLVAESTDLKYFGSIGAELRRLEIEKIRGG